MTRDAQMPVDRIFTPRHARSLALVAIALTIALTIVACDRRGATADSSSTPAAATAVSDSLFARFAQSGMPGASVLVVRHDSVLLRRSFGLADVEQRTAATPETNYRLASLTKQFTATAIVLLVRDGKLSLDAPIRDFLPTLPSYAASVTVRHLLTHTSGLWDYEDFVPDSQLRQVHDDEIPALLRAHAESTYFAPGSAWRYSNTGYALLSLIVERVSGMRFGDFLRARIFEPLGMLGTFAHEDGRTTVPHRAWGYTVHGDSVERTDQSNTSAVLGDGGVYSSIDDLAKWHASLDRAPLVGDSLWRVTTTPFTLRDGTATTYGFGWFVEQFHGHARLRHHGESRGFTNAVSRFPDDGLTIVVLTNRTGSAPWEIADSLALRYFP